MAESQVQADWWGKTFPILLSEEPWQLLCLVHFLTPSCVQEVSLKHLCLKNHVNEVLRKAFGLPKRKITKTLALSSTQIAPKQNYRKHKAAACDGRNGAPDDALIISKHL